MFDDFEIPQSDYEKALSLQNILVARVEGPLAPSQNAIYAEIRRNLMSDAAIKELLPQFVRTCRDLSQFWGYIKDVSPQWEPRRRHIRDGFTQLLDHLEGRNAAPSDTTISESLTNFDADGVGAVWAKALGRRQNDPEGAITAARTLLETVCKRVLDDVSPGGYTDADDLPKLYRAAAEQLNLAPSQHTEEAFRRILGGCTSVVEGLGTLRNKIGDAHGRGGLPTKPAARHAELAVNFAGAMAKFLVETWSDRKGGE